ncbi:iron uptake porin [Coleofasciculus sp. FACHB-1120]|uniref:iron uptake porin n=1 Tax=Coleofasciculus sp. FACHB-1120 TaxID=2692783 RepID=UPI0016841F4D|nr:iron uptake porin [Coleofasciculus sp. FACHB-1120]MBD2742632.1 iron uptake porin [Coleofasciculus sp. FACHB-1120]
MAKLMWKSLLVSPAVFGAALVLSSAAIAAEKPITSEVIQPQTTESNLPKVQSVALVTALQAPEANSAPVFSATAKSAEALSAVEVETPEQLAVAPIQDAATANSAEALKVEKLDSTSVPVMPVVETPAKVAATPIQDAATADSAEALGVDNSVLVPMAAPTNSTLAQSAPAANTVDNNSVLEQINRYSREGNNSQSQVTNVSQLSDVEPTDWAYEALRSLVERYGCIAGYPDGTYRGNRAMSRYEFAAGLNACLLQIEKLIAASTADFVTKEDLATLQRLIDEFGAELATLRTRVDNLEGRVTFLENHQFSTTTKLVGEAIFAVTDSFTGDISISDFNVDVDDRGTNTIFGDRVRLDLQTSFTGRDILHTRLAAGNLGVLTPDTAEGTQTFNLGFNDENTNDIGLDWLAYEFPFGASQVYISATGGRHSDYTPVLNPYFYNGVSDSGSGSLSTFAQYSPIYRIGGGAGAGLRLGVGRAPILGPTSLTVGYLADNANNPADSTLVGSIPPGQDINQHGGLFNGDYSALAQLNFTVSDRFGLAATYVHGYHSSGNAIFDSGRGGAVVGTGVANTPGLIGPLLGLNAPQLGIATDPAPGVSNSYGLQGAFRLGDRVSLSGFVSYSDVRVIGDGDGEIWSYGLGIAFPDLGKRGNVLGIFAGAQPYLGSLELDGKRVPVGKDRPYHIEAFYKYQLTENISVTPGVIWLTAPGQTEANDDAVIGTLRTTFSF